MASPLALFKSIAVVLVVVGLVLAMGIYMTSKFNEKINDTDAQTALGDIITELKGLTTWISIIVIALIAVVIFGLLRGFGKAATV